MNQLEKLGIKIGTQKTIVDNRIQKSEENYDVSLQVVRKGNGMSPRDMLDRQLSKGSSLVYKEPKLVRMSNHADDQLDADDSWQKKRLEQQNKADAEFEYEKDFNYARGSHGEEFHSDASLPDYAIHEVDREFGAESRPAKSKARRDDYVGDDQGEKQYTYKSENNLFLKAIDALDDLVKAIDPSEKMAKDAVNIKKEKMSKKQMNLVANMHENSPAFTEKKKSYSDVEKANPLFPIKPSKTVKKEPKDPEEKNIEREERGEAEKSCMTKSDIDELYDLIKGGSVQEIAKEEAAVRAAPIAKSGKSEYLRRSHIRSAGQGGLVFDFGPLTGNPIADNATALLNAHGDQVQMNNAKYQSSEYNKAIDSYVEKGDAAFSSTNSPFSNLSGAADLDKPMDQQVAEAFAKGLLDNDKSTPAVKNHHNEKQMTVGGEIVKATSETDAALIEMMKAQGMDLSDMAGHGAVDATGGGATKVIAGLD